VLSRAHPEGDAVEKPVERAVVIPEVHDEE
jgi:hypothetical protein